MKPVILSQTTSMLIYKVGKTLNRRNAKRHLVAKIYAKDREEAISKFVELVSSEFNDTDKATYELYTGDWKLVYTFY